MSFSSSCYFLNYLFKNFCEYLLHDQRSFFIWLNLSNTLLILWIFKKINYNTCSIWFNFINKNGYLDLWMIYFSSISISNKSNKISAKLNISFKGLCWKDVVTIIPFQSIGGVDKFLKKIFPLCDNAFLTTYPILHVLDHFVKSEPNLTIASFELFS